MCVEVYTNSTVCARCVRVWIRACRCTSHSFLGLFPAHPSGTRVLLLRSAAWLPPCPALPCASLPSSSPVFCLILPPHPLLRNHRPVRCLPPSSSPHAHRSTPLTSILAIFPKLPAPASSSRPLLWFRKPQFAFGLSAPSAQFPLPLLAFQLERFPCSPHPLGGSGHRRASPSPPRARLRHESGAWKRAVHKGVGQVLGRVPCGTPASDRGRMTSGPKGGEGGGPWERSSAGKARLTAAVTFLREERSACGQRTRQGPAT